MAEIVHRIDEAAARLEKSVVTIGNFDGMHIGHQAIFAEAIAQARERGATAVALTFEPHPVAFFRPERAPLRLAPPPFKFDLIGTYGVDLIVSLEFDAELSGKSPKQFVEEILVAGLKAEHVVVGEDFRFGAKRAGNAQMLEELGAIHQLSRTASKRVEWEAEVVSSSRIREAVTRGDLKAARAMLGRPFRLYGEVEPGEARGRVLGFPTANMKVCEMAQVPEGIYITTLGRRGGVHWRGATSIGTRPTFGGGERTVETFIFDERIEEGLDLYGDEVELDIYHRLRDEEKFNSAEDLVAQMKRDVAAAKNYFDAEGFDGG